MKRGRKKQNNCKQKNDANNSSKTYSLSINEADLMELGLFESEKTAKVNNNDNKTDQLEENSMQTQFDNFLNEAIDEASSALGELVKNTVYTELERSFNMPKTESRKELMNFPTLYIKSSV